MLRPCNNSAGGSYQSDRLGRSHRSLSSGSVQGFIQKKPFERFELTLIGEDPSDGFEMSQSDTRVSGPHTGSLLTRPHIAPSTKIPKRRDHLYHMTGNVVFKRTKSDNCMLYIYCPTITIRFTEKQRELFHCYLIR